jgi:hypothetical protein
MYLFIGTSLEYVLNFHVSSSHRGALSTKNVCNLGKRKFVELD